MYKTVYARATSAMQMYSCRELDALIDRIEEIPTGILRAGLARPPQKSTAAAAAGRVLPQTKNSWFGAPAKHQQHLQAQQAKNPSVDTTVHRAMLPT
jgi:type II secretory pathway component HofQ